MGQQQAKKQAGLSDQRPVTVLRIAQALPAQVEDRDALALSAGTLEKALARTRCRALCSLIPNSFITEG